MKLITSGRIEDLAGVLAEQLKSPAGGVLQPEMIVVQSQGMAQWLRLDLASRLGVCMNVEFPFPRKFILGTLAQFWPEEARSTSCEPSDLAWRIFQVLPGLSGSPGFEAVEAYLGPEADPRKTYQLAVRLADCLDQYATYRPEWIRVWEQGDNIPAAHGWQAQLWRAIMVGQSGMHPALLISGFNDEAGGLAKPEMRPARAFAVLTTLMPPAHLELFKALAPRLEVVLLVLGSCRTWFDVGRNLDADRNPLLQSGGRYGRELARLVRGQEAPAPTRPTFPTNMLGVIQRDLHDDLGPEDGIARIAPTESSDPGLCSLQVHACHGPKREVEVLHDHILHWLNRGDLQPRDILVVTPDLDTYAPCIAAVFDAGVAGQPTPGQGAGPRQTVPYVIADRAVRRESPLSDAFLRLLDLEGTRLGAPAVLDLLEAEPVRTKFSLTEPDVEQVAGWVEASGIRWGADADQREQLGLPKVPETTWRFGLDRLLLGYAMPGLAEAPATETAGTTRLVPCLEVEGEGALVMGRFVDFVERVFQGLKGLEEKRSLADWSKTLLELLDQVFDLEQDADGVGQVRDALEALAAEGLAVPGEELVAFAAVREALRSELEESGGSPEVFRGGVSVCGMRLMRGVPFRVVCVLGMNDGAFPRRNQRPGFDLLTGDVRAGAPSPRHDDRYLFLQLLQSARERFYLSYLGQSDRDNAELPPSVLVSELLDYAEARFLPADGATKVAKWLTVRHPLHRFSPTYFGAPANGEPGAAANRPGSLFSYSTESCAAARQLAAGGGSPWVFANKPLPEPGPEFRTLRVADLVAFLKNPSRYFLEQRLKLKLREKDRHELAEDELFGLNDLQRYSLENELLGKLMKAPQTADAAERIRPRWVAECRLPLGEPGRAEHGSVATYAGWLGEGLMAQGVQATESLTVNLTIGEFRLKGSVPVNATGGVLHWRAGKLREVDRLETWVEHLVALTMNKGGASRLIGEAQTANKETKLPLLQVRTYAQADDARTVLQELLDLYWRGLACPLPFFPKSAMAYAEKMADPEADEETQEEAQKAARGQWEGNPPHAKGENVDIHFESCFRGLDNPLDDKFENVAMEIYEPLLRHEAAPENLP